jgi:hypothetical protein
MDVAQGPEAGAVGFGEIFDGNDGGHACKVDGVGGGAGGIVR